MARKKIIKEEAKIPKKSKRVMLTDTIQDLYFRKGYDNDSIPWAGLMAQVKTIEREHNLSDDDMRLTITYMDTFENIDISDMDNLGLIPYYVDKCRKYIVKYKENKKKSKEFQFDDVTNIVVKRRDVERNIIKKHDTFD
jgi:hypothetical protein